MVGRASADRPGRAVLTVRKPETPSQEVEAQSATSLVAALLVQGANPFAHCSPLSDAQTRWLGSTEETTR